MSDLKIDYENQNKFLPESLRNFVGATNRITRQNFQEFLTMYSGIELLAVMNNLYAAEYSSGYTKFNLTYMRSGIPPKLQDILVSKIVGKVSYQTSGDEKALNDKFDSYYFSQMLAEAYDQAASTGRCAIVVYGNSEEQEAHIECYNLFRHRLEFGKKNEVVKAHFFLNRIDGLTAGYEYVIEEQRYYKKKKLDDGTIEFMPIQKFIVNRAEYKMESKEDAIVSELDNIPDEIAVRYPNIEFNIERELKGFNSIGVFHIDFTKLNKKFPDLNIPEAMFVDAVDQCLMLETSITDREVEKEIGRAQILIPEFGKGQQLNTYMTQADAGSRMLRTVATSYRNPVIMPYPSMKMEDNKPYNIQFDIRADQWENAINGDVARLCSIVGISVLDYDPRLLQTGQRTDDEINAMTDITANTVTKLRNINTYEINKCLECVGTLLGIPTPISIRWSLANIINPTKNANLVKQLYETGLISRKEAIKRVNPDLTDNEVDEMIKDIDSENENKSVPIAFDNF